MLCGSGGSNTDRGGAAWYGWMLLVVGALLLCCLLYFCLATVCSRNTPKENASDLYFHPQSYKHLLRKTRVREAQQLKRWVCVPPFLFF